jgi:hypothetical protein
MTPWSAFHSCNGSNGTRNPIGNEMFGSANLPMARTSRATTAGEVRVRTRGIDTHVTHGLEVWNACRELRESRSRAEASPAAMRLARESPLSGGLNLAIERSLGRTGTEISRENFSGKFPRSAKRCRPYSQTAPCQAASRRRGMPRPRPRSMSRSRSTRPSCSTWRDHVKVLLLSFFLERKERFRGG